MFSLAHKTGLLVMEEETGMLTNSTLEINNLIIKAQIHFNIEPKKPIHPGINMQHDLTVSRCTYMADT